MRLRISLVRTGGSNVAWCYRRAVGGIWPKCNAAADAQLPQGGRRVVVPAHGAAGADKCDTVTRTTTKSPVTSGAASWFIWFAHDGVCHSKPYVSCCVLHMQMGSLAVSATWGLLLYVCTRFSWTRYDAGKQDVSTIGCARKLRLLQSLLRTC
jgi:hypothetical protein